MSRASFRKRKQRKKRLGALEGEILAQLTLGDLLYNFLLSAHSTKRFYQLARERATDRYRRKQAIERLIDANFIEARGERLAITSQGRNVFGEAINKTRQLLGTSTWDFKWRVAAYDIPERYAELRKKVRAILKKAGFVKLQQSIWIFPHECEDLVQLIKQESQLSKHILYGVLERIEDEPRLKKLFHL
ncbi:MAG TPA: hypothetical protein VI483_03065 [Candidatus Paceibacterota bacterium]